MGIRRFARNQEPGVHAWILKKQAMNKFRGRIPNVTNRQKQFEASIVLLEVASKIALEAFIQASKRFKNANSRRTTFGRDPTRPDMPRRRNDRENTVSPAA